MTRIPDYTIMHSCICMSKEREYMNIQAIRSAAGGICETLYFIHNSSVCSLCNLPVINLTIRLAAQSDSLKHVFYP